MNAGWKDAITKQVEDEVRKKTVELATVARDLLYTEFRRIVDVFYGEYNPVVYYRHGMVGGSGGLHKSYKKYYKNSHDAVHGVYGGVEISNSNMATDYNIDNGTVLNSFLTGWHGPVFMGIPGIDAYNEIVAFRDHLTAADLLK